MPTPTTTVVVLCDYVRTTRFRGLLEAHPLFIATGSAGAIAGQRGKRKRGWVAAAANALNPVEAAVHLRENQSLDRCFMAIYATDRRCGSVANLAVASWAAARAAAAATGGGGGGGDSISVRVHVFDADSEDGTFQTELISALAAVGATLSPTDYTSVVVAVRMEGALTWSLLLRQQFALMRPVSTPKQKVLCRAAYKLLDALQLLAARNITIDTALPALDIGASPGGWTEALLVSLYIHTTRIFLNSITSGYIIYVLGLPPPLKPLFSEEKCTHLPLLSARGKPTLCSAQNETTYFHSEPS